MKAMGLTEEFERFCGGAFVCIDVLSGLVTTTSTSRVDHTDVPLLHLHACRSQV